MWLGYRTYPDAFLLEADEAILRDSPFISAVRGRQALPDCSVLVRRPQ